MTDRLRRLRKASAFLFGVLFYLLVYPVAYGSADPVAGCERCVRDFNAGLTHDFHQLEDQFIRYQWLERKMWRLYYEDLWKIRNAMQHPLDAVIRKRAETEESALLSLIENTETGVRTAGNDFYILIQKMKLKYQETFKCCGHPDYRACVQERYEPFRVMLDEVKQDFDRIYERNREIRTVILGTVGGAEGLYQEEALETSDRHYDFYQRFYEEREPAFYRDDTVMMKHFNEMQHYVYLNNHLGRCCLACRITDV